MISYSDALQIIRDTASCRKLATETVSLENAIGRVCAEDLTAALDIQPFDNAAMDGFAVRVDNLARASEANPVHLKQSGVIGAGQSVLGKHIEGGSCWHVMTGASLPKGTEGIVPIEDVVIEGETVIFIRPPKQEQHIRRAGQDFRKGSIIALTGERISPAHILPLGTLGISRFAVSKKPRVLFISTGTEVVDDLNTSLGEGQIYNSNKPYASAFLRACGAEIDLSKTIRDDQDSFLGALKAAEEEGYDMVVSSGAVSAGTYDFVKAGLEKFGAEILYHKIKLKPGKPNLFARLPGGALYFGLPGNPVATSVGLRFFVAEALRVLQGQKQESPVFARAMNRFSKKPGLHMVLKSRLESWEDGSLSVDILDGQESFMVSPFLMMNGWLHVPEDTETIKAGDVVEIYPLQPQNRIL
jgi:molybdopterin molybdotransferase